MTKHFLYKVGMEDKVPGGGDPLSWLNYYKLDKDNEETYVPFGGDCKGAEPGDILWFMYAKRTLLARVPILRVMEDAINQCTEIWYDASQLTKFESEHGRQGILVAYTQRYATGVLETALAEEWMKRF